MERKKRDSLRLSRNIPLPTAPAPYHVHACVCHRQRGGNGERYSDANSSLQRILLWISLFEKWSSSFRERLQAPCISPFSFEYLFPPSLFHFLPKKTSMALRGPMQETHLPPLLPLLHLSKERGLYSSSTSSSHIQICINYERRKKK